ncbi:Alpha/Beta hydrolase protein [Xylariomycetidae sp. FL2044]|nr:Alpha/Beta hydrolase protein [Xylariomycetidae sp. FL2044]
MLFLSTFITLLLAALYGHSAAAAAPAPTKAKNEVVKRAALTQVTSFGANTSGTKMYIYVPDNLASTPAIVVAIHYCSGTASAYYSGTPYATLAEQYGFIVIYPESPYSGTCWDVSSPAALTHDGGADSNSIANMVTYTIDTYGADASRVFVTGSSSGAMMTNVLAATYPEMFQAAVVYSGVPAGCFYTGTVNGWNSTCSSGSIDESPDYWAAVALAMYPGYEGARPRMRIHHGSADTTLYPQNYNETIDQWTGVFGYDTAAAPEAVYANDPASPYTRYVYGENVEGVYGTGVTHNIQIFGDADMEWFGISGGGSQVPPTTTTTTTTAPPAATTTAGSGQTVPKWGQCGGIGYAGPTACAMGSTCTYSNDYYSQCL